MNDLSPGISVVIPTFRGAKHIHRLLDSLAAQTADPSEFEIIVVLNGPEDGTRALLESFQSKNLALTCRVLTVATAGAAIARNAGLANARREYVTFVDDDDRLQPAYLETALHMAAPNSVALLPMFDEKDGVLNEATTLNVRIRALAGSSVPLASAPWALGFNSSKVVPTKIASRYRYEKGLSSGEDVVYFAHLLRHQQLRISVPQHTNNSAYIRVLREGSVSRREDSFDFCVRQRFQVVAALQRISVPVRNLQARRSLEKSQLGFVERYLSSNPDEFQQTANVALEIGVRQVTWTDFRPAARVDRLVISYCFPPFADPAANVVAKRICARGEVVDVICGNMEAVRKLDLGSLEMVEPWIRNRSVINVYPSFSGWPLICEFATQAIARTVGSQYKSLYSRALWSGSHVAGLLYKLRHPDVHWAAEFSDPMRFDATGTHRVGNITPGRVTRELRDIVASSSWPGLELATHFELTEAATFIAADEIVFSNENQREVMLEVYPDSFQHMVACKSQITAQPIPSGSMYSARSAKLSLDSEVFNLGYFGNFYKNRGLDTITSALRKLDPQLIQNCALHVFSGETTEIQSAVEEAGIPEVLHVHEPLPYLNFLNATQQFDALIVVDTDTSETRYSVNPFLPSKYADYVGSGVPVWAMVEVGSPLYRLAPEHVSHLRDVEGAYRVLTKLMGVRG